MMTANNISLIHNDYQLGNTTSQTSMLTCFRENEGSCRCDLVRVEVTLTSTQGPPRPDADNHWHPLMQRNQMTREESSNL